MEEIKSRTVTIHLGLLLTGGLLCVSAEAADPDYIDAIKADVAEFTTHEFQTPPDSSWVGSGSESSQNGGTQSMDLNGFSAFLQKKTPGSYIFYEKLSMKYKQKLHGDYLATGDLDRVKADIFKYSREARKN
jgi:hypothetical protein